MKNLFDATVANQVKTRLGKLEPQSERRWGKMTAALLVAYSPARRALAPCHPGAALRDLCHESR